MEQFQRSQTLQNSKVRLHHFFIEDSILVVALNMDRLESNDTVEYNVGNFRLKKKD